MKFEPGDYSAMHESPIWRDRADFIIAAHLGEKDGRNEWEQIWASKAGRNRFIVCCIPFFAHDVALGDEVETNIDNVIQRVVRPGGQTTFRVWFREQDPSRRNESVQEIAALNASMEWSSDNLLALSANDGADAQRLAGYLRDRESEGGLQYDTGRT